MRMNKRDYKEFETGEWYHLFTRGNGKMEIFRDRQDYFVFLQRFSMALGSDVTPSSRAPLESQGAPLRNPIRVTPFDPGTFSVGAYCLMPNHFHFLIQQNGEIPISKLFLRLLTSYSMYFNRKYEHVGHVFQDRFKAVHIEGDTQLKHVSAYIHQNPKVAGLVRDLSKWQYSSYPEYLGKVGGGVCDTTKLLEHFSNVSEYQRFVEDSFEDIRARKDSVRELMMDI